MNTHTVLFATDFSKPSLAALDRAARVAKAHDAELLIAHIIEPGAVYAFDAAYIEISEQTKYPEIERRLREVMPADTTIPVRHELLIGDPAREIVHLAERNGSEMIVMTTHGRTGVQRWLLGSVAEQVVRLAKCPVLIVKPVEVPAARGAARETKELGG